MFANLLAFFNGQIIVCLVEKRQKPGLISIQLNQTNRAQMIEAVRVDFLKLIRVKRQLIQVL